MATLAQLQAEAAWRAEFTPVALMNLGTRLAAYFRIPPSAVGTRGNTSHLSGYHRSRRWVKTSAYCVSRTYSVSRTAGDRSGGSDDAVSGMDVTLPTTQLLPACQRLDIAVRAGRLEKITEWYGNVDGDQQVDGYDNISNRVASSDSSHLWHLHMSFDRGRVDEDHTDVFRVLTGEREDDEDMAIAYNTPAGYFLSNGVNRRPVLARGEVFLPAVRQPGYQVIELTNAQRVSGGYATWEAYLDDVAGPLLAVAGAAQHVHTTGPAVPAATP